MTLGPGAAGASGREIMLMSDSEHGSALSAHRRAQRSSLNLITNHNHLKPEDMGIFGISSHRVRITLVEKYCYSTRRFRRLHLGRLTALRPRWHYEKTLQNSVGPRWSSGKLSHEILLNINVQTPAAPFYVPGVERCRVGALSKQQDSTSCGGGLQTAYFDLLIAKLLRSWSSVPFHHQVKRWYINTN